MRLRSIADLMQKLRGTQLTRARENGAFVLPMYNFAAFTGKDIKKDSDYVRIPFIISDKDYSVFLRLSDQSSAAEGVDDYCFLPSNKYLDSKGRDLIKLAASSPTAAFSNAYVEQTLAARLTAIQDSLRFLKENKADAGSIGGEGVTSITERLVFGKAGLVESQDVLGSGNYYTVIPTRIDGSWVIKQVDIVAGKSKITNANYSVEIKLANMCWDDANSADGIEVTFASANLASNTNLVGASKLFHNGGTATTDSVYKYNRRRYDSSAELSGGITLPSNSKLGWVLKVVSSGIEIHDLQVVLTVSREPLG